LDAHTLLAELNEEKLSLLILEESRVLYCSRADSIKPLVEAIDLLGPNTLKGSTVVDRIIGKASALLICYFGAGAAVAEVMSARGTKVLDLYGVKHFANTSVREIRNRSGTGTCPFEKIVLRVENPAEAYHLIKQKLRNETL
jgi:hypothetical protein